MRRIVVLALAALLVFACKVEKTGKDTYKVIAPTPQAKKAGEKAKEEAKTAVEKLKQATEKVGEKAKTVGEKAKDETTEATRKAKHN